MCSLLKVANRRPVDLISPFLVHKEQITSVGSTGDNAAALACFSLYRPRFFHVIRVFYAFSAFRDFCHPCRAASTLVLVRSRTQRVCNALRMRTARVADYLITSSGDGSFQHEGGKRIKSQQNRVRVLKVDQGRSPSSLILVQREAHCEELSSVACNALCGQNVGKQEA